MILTQLDIDDFTEAYEKYSDFELVTEGEYWTNESILAWLTEHPQVVVAGNFQEYSAARGSRIYRTLVADGELDNVTRPLFRQYAGSWIVPSEVSYEPAQKWDAFSLEELLHAASLESQLKSIDVATPITEYDKLRQLIDESSVKAVIEMPSFNEIIERATKLIDNPLIDPTAWVSPRLWTPSQQEAEKLHLQRASTSLLRHLQQGTVDLCDIHWREFEELVAEILRSLGLEVHLVRENPQGGRDIIARAPAIGGLELATIAVEVKHRGVIDRPLLQQTIQQNQHFPTLMFVTSGRFTAGVIRELAKLSNRMRIILKDGVAVRDLIKNYQLT